MKDDAVIKMKKKDENGEEIDEEIETKRLNVTVWVRETKTDEVFQLILLCMIWMIFLLQEK